MHVYEFHIQVENYSNFYIQGCYKGWMEVGALMPHFRQDGNGLNVQVLKAVNCKVGHATTYIITQEARYYLAHKPYELD